jgi:hypothetical protein
MARMMHTRSPAAILQSAIRAAGRHLPFGDRETV